jgi:hypothetical protein
MTYEEILPFCLFFKGEALVPQQYNQQNEGQLWLAEKMICEEFNNQIRATNPTKDIAGLVAAYIGKWNPYGFQSVMKTYFNKLQDPRIEKIIGEIYN